MNASWQKDPTEEKARDLLEGRIESIRQLKKAQDDERGIAVILKERQAETARLWRAALDAGWTEQELTKALGIEKPSKLAGRPRKRTASKPKPKLNDD